MGLLIIIAAATAALLWNNTKKTQTPSPSPQPQLSKIRVAYITLNRLYAIPLTIASEKGLFKKYNLEADIQTVPTISAQLLVGGQADAILNMPFASLTASIEGGKLSWIGTLISDSSRVLISGKDPRDIKTLVYPGAGGPFIKIRVIQLLKELNLDPTKITLKEVDSEQVAFANLLDKKVDAIGNIVKSDWLIAKKKNNLSDEFKILISTLDKEDLKMGAGIIVRNEFLETNKAAVENLAKALVEATAWVRTNKQEAVRILADQLNISTDEAEIYLDEYIAITDNTTFAPSKEQAQDLLKIALQTNPKAKDYQIENFLNFEIAETLVKSGFLSQFGFK